MLNKNKEIHNNFFKFKSYEQIFWKKMKKIIKYIFLALIITANIWSEEDHSFEAIWAEVQPTYQKIVQHPFVQEMTSGILPTEKFLTYNQQDVFYLLHNAYAFRQAAMFSPSSFEEKYLTQIAEKIEIELPKLYQLYIEKITDFQPTRECELYIDHLLNAANSNNYYFATGSIMSCVVCFKYLAKDLYEKVNPLNPYFDWFESNKKTENSVEKVKGFINYVLRNATEQEYQDFLKGFALSLNFEKAFWEGNYATAISSN